MTLVEQLGDDRWKAVCAACCHKALAFAIMHLCKKKKKKKNLSIPYFFFKIVSVN